ncbi:MAG: glycosyltransferase family 2 protein [Parcubacteria group bacterium]
MISNKENNYDLSVIIVNYKSEHYLEQCLASIYRTIGGQMSFEIIIVNNYPEEKLEKIRQSFPGTKVIVSSKNGGFGQGNNVGAWEASGEYLWLLNPDTEVITGDLRSVMEEFRQNAGLGALGCCLMTEYGKIQEWGAGTEITLWDLLKNNLGICASRKIWESGNRQEAAWVAGTALFVRKDLFLGIGGIDEDIFMYFEDVDLCKRIREAGRQVFYFPEIKILHKCGGSYGEDGKKRQKQNYYDSLVYYFKKHRPRLETSIVKTLRKSFFN